MNHKWTALAAAALLAGSAGTAWGQDTGGGGLRAGPIDLGVYAGGSLTSNWFMGRTITLDGTPTGSENGDDQDYAPGYGPSFGAIANLWFSPVFGIRVHGNYTAMRLPFASTGFFDVSPNNGESGSYSVNTWFADLNLLLRPFAMRQWAGIWRGVYLFAGGGAVLVDLAGTDAPVCEGTLAALGACLSYEPKQATVGQGTAGVGMDLLRLGGSSLVVFGELAAHVYDSPVHVGDDFVGPVTGLVGSSVAVADDQTAVTGRLSLGLKLVVGDIIPYSTKPPPPPEPMPPPAEPMPPPPPPVAATSDIRVCVVQGGQVSTVTGVYNPAAGDTTVNGRRLNEAYPGGTGYASGASWFINNEPLTFNGRRYVKYGLPRTLGEGEVASAGTYQGVPVFAESAAGMRPEVIYLPVTPFCEFQPYQVETKAGSVRG